MDEKVLVKSERCNHKNLWKIVAIFDLLLLVVWLWQCYESRTSYANPQWSDAISYFFNPPEWSSIYADWTFKSYIIYALGVVLLGYVVYMWIRSYELTVTDKRIYGKVAFGKRIDLPVDSVSATATGLFKGVSVSTSSGRIRFRMLKNANEIYDVLNKLIIERQSKPQSAQPIVTEKVVADEADKLKKFKALLDEGIITQEEFDAKKKELLGL